MPRVKTAQDFKVVNDFLLELLVGLETIILVFAKALLRTPNSDLVNADEFMAVCLKNKRGAVFMARREIEAILWSL